MQSNDRPARASKAARRAGYVMSGLPALFLLIDAVGKLAKPAPVMEETVRLGYAEGSIVTIGTVLLTCVVVYLIQRTAVLGAILLTGYLGGAVATHVRMGGGAFPILFPVAIGALLWGGLLLRDPRLRALLPARRPAGTGSQPATTDALPEVEPT